MKNILIKILIPLLVIAGGAGYYYNKVQNDKKYEDRFQVQRGDIESRVSFTGEVTAKERVNLSFETNGTIEDIFVQEDEKINQGDRVAKLENQELRSRLQEARSNLDNARAVLNQKKSALETRKAELKDLKQGPQQEEIQQARTEISNAKKSLADAKKELETTKQRAESNLQSKYISALSAAQKAASVAKNVIITATELQYKYFTQGGTDGPDIGSAKRDAVRSLLGAKNAGWWREESLSTLTGGAFGEVQKAIETQNPQDIDRAIDDLISALQDVSNMLEKIPIINDFSSQDKSVLANEKNKVKSQIEIILNKKDAISSQKATNKSNITAAETKVTQAQNRLQSARETLSVLLAGASKEKIEAKEKQISEAKAAIESQRSAIQQAAANVNRIRNQIDKTVIKSPIDGLVAKIYPEKGETVNPSQNIATIITPTKQIEADVSELDISEIKEEDRASITLDAFDNDKKFKAEIISIDSAETIINNVPTYEVEFQFIESYKQVKPGMTANINVVTNRATSTLYLPSRTIQGSEGNEFVYVLRGEDIEKRNIKTGLKSTNDGKVEITSGLKEGDTVVTGVKQ